MAGFYLYFTSILLHLKVHYLLTVGFGLSGGIHTHKKYRFKSILYYRFYPRYSPSQQFFLKTFTCLPGKSQQFNISFIGLQALFARHPSSYYQKTITCCQESTTFIFQACESSGMLDELKYYTQQKVNFYNETNKMINTIHSKGQSN